MGIGALRHVVVFQVPATVADGDGGYTDTWIDLDPPWFVSIRPASVHDLERRAAGTVTATATHVIAGRYRPDVGLDARMIFDGRTFLITGVQNVDERGIDGAWFAVETV